MGFSGLRSIDWQSQVAVSGSVIGRKDLWGQGIGTDAANVRNHYAFDVLGLRLLIATVIADNAASLAMLAKAGYTEVGRVPERYWKRGAYRDQAILALHREDDRGSKNASDCHFDERRNTSQSVIRRFETCERRYLRSVSCCRSAGKFERVGVFRHGS